jgi:hypothetical protein
MNTVNPAIVVPASWKKCSNTTKTNGVTIKEESIPYSRDLLYLKKVEYFSSIKILRFRKLDSSGVG